MKALSVNINTEFVLVGMYVIILALLSVFTLTGNFHPLIFAVFGMYTIIVYAFYAIKSGKWLHGTVIMLLTFSVTGAVFNTLMYPFADFTLIIGSLTLPVLAILPAISAIKLKLSFYTRVLVVVTSILILMSIALQVVDSFTHKSHIPAYQLFNYPVLLLLFFTVFKNKESSMFNELSSPLRVLVLYFGTELVIKLLI